MSEYILRVENAKKSFGGVDALKGVSLDILRGEIHCLAGENGCGKSTLIKIVSGFYQADAGTIEIDDKKFSHITPLEAIERGVQVIYQDFSVFPNLTVMENLAINMELMNRRKLVNYRRMRGIAMEAVAKIGFDIDLDERVENLSIADKQLVAVCRALLYDAKLIIMDEPTTALTKKEVRALFAVIKNLQSQGIAVLFVSHKLDEVFEISERITIIRNGENAKTGNTADMDGKKFALYMTGREFKEECYRPESLQAEPILKVEDFSLPGAFSGVSFDLHSGEILGITGLLGSGRTELVQSLFGIQRGASGRIEIDGADARIASVSDAIKRGLGYVPADRLTEGLFLTQSIRRNVVATSLDSLTGHGGLLDEALITEQTEHWVADLAVATTDVSRPVQTLSGGNQQKVVLARWLANDLKVLILNGPTVGVDIGSKYDIHELLRSLAAKGLAIIVISDDLPEILACCNRVLVMRDGSIVEDLDASDTSEARLAEIATGVA